MLQFILGSGSSAGSISTSANKLLESAKKIDEYMADNDYYYPNPLKGPFDTNYDDGNSKRTCCATFVSWCLQDAGFINQHTDYSGDIYNWLKDDSNWELVNVSDMADLQPGDVGVYYDDDYYHSNIYAGDSKFWDAGTDEKVKSKGTTSHNVPTYVFRYKN